MAYSLRRWPHYVMGNKTGGWHYSAWPLIQQPSFSLVFLHDFTPLVGQWERGSLSPTGVNMILVCAE